MEVDWTFAKLLEVVRAQLTVTAGIDFNMEEPKCFLSQEIKHCASSRVQVMMSLNAAELMATLFLISTLLQVRLPPLKGILHLY